MTVASAPSLTLYPSTTLYPGTDYRVILPTTAEVTDPDRFTTVGLLVPDPFTTTVEA